MIIYNQISNFYRLYGKDDRFGESQSFLPLMINNFFSGTNTTQAGVVSPPPERVNAIPPSQVGRGRPAPQKFGGRMICRDPPPMWISQEFRQAVGFHCLERSFSIINVYVSLSSDFSDSLFFRKLASLFKDSRP